MTWPSQLKHKIVNFSKHVPDFISASVAESTLSIHIAAENATSSGPKPIVLQLYGVDVLIP